MEDKPNDPIAGQCESAAPIYYAGVSGGPVKVPYAEIEKLRTKDREDRERFHAQTEGSWDGPSPNTNTVSSDHRLYRAIEKMRAIGERDRFQGQVLLQQAEAIRALIDALPHTLSPLAAEGLNVLLNRAGL